MADSCSALRTMLAAQTPVYDQIFLEDWKPLDSPIMGRHQTEVWKQGTGDTHYQDRIEIGQPDLTTQWQSISAAECAASCTPPRKNVSWGTTRSTHGMEQFRIQSPLMCLTQLRYNTRPAEQIARIYQGLKKFPEMYDTDFMRVHAFDLAPTVQVAQSTFPTFTPVRGTNTDGQLTEINMSGTGNLPTSELTFPYLDYLSTELGLQGYSQAGSGLADGMYNLVLDPRSWFKLTNGNPSMKDMMALGDSAQASPLYKIGQGIQKPFGNYAPTLDKQPIRFQHVGSGVLNRVFPYYNAATTTGIKRTLNPAYVNAQYQLSFIWHPKAIKIFTPDFKKMNEMVPSVNSAMFGTWTLINPEGVMQYTQPDGTVCTLNNDERLWFYWLCALEMGFQYQYPELLMPILHLVDGSGYSSTVDSPVCGSAPSYTAQTYSDDQSVCQA
jgi:hypothetical protein